MLELANKVAKAFADLTVGSVIVLVHVAMADRERAHALHHGSARAAGSSTGLRVARSSTQHPTTVGIHASTM